METVGLCRGGVLEIYGANIDWHHVWGQYMASNGQVSDILDTVQCVGLFYTKKKCYILYKCELPPDSPYKNVYTYTYI